MAGYSPWGCKESNTTEQLTLSFFHASYIHGKDSRKLPESRPEMTQAPVLNIISIWRQNTLEGEKPVMGDFQAKHSIQGDGYYLDLS